MTPQTTLPKAARSTPAHQPRAPQGREANEPMRDLQRRMVEYCRHQPRTRYDVASELKISYELAVSVAKRLCQRFRLAPVRDGNAHWLATPELADKLLARKAGTSANPAPGVTIAAHREWLQPAPPSVCTAIVDGRPVRVTVGHCPPDRFAVAVKPGTGVISQDNPQLARLAKRRRTS